MENITKTAMVTIAGRPNVGKSTLVNALVGEKIAIVSSKPQTTRNRICGVVNQGDTQFIFLDTPGFHKARTRLGDYMVKVVKDSVADVEAVCLLVEPIANVGAPEQALIDRIREDHPDAEIILQTILPVSAKQDAKGSYVNNQRIGVYNEVIRALAEEKDCALVDVAEALAGEDGCLPKELHFDGVHLNPAGCRIWLEYLRTHSVEEKK